MMKEEPPMPLPEAETSRETIADIALKVMGQLYKTDQTLGRSKYQAPDYELADDVRAEKDALWLIRGIERQKLVDLLKADPGAMPEIFQGIQAARTVGVLLLRDAAFGAGEPAERALLELLTDNREWHEVQRTLLDWRADKILSESATEKDKNRPESRIISVDDAFALFPANVLAAFASGELHAGGAVKSRSSRDHLNEKMNWSAADRARIAHALVAKEGSHEALAFLDIDELPIPDAHVLRGKFYQVYLRRAPDKIIANAEFFADFIRQNGKPEEAIALLEQCKVIEPGETSNIEVPTKDEFDEQNFEQLGATFIRNHQRLLKRVMALGDELPMIGLHGSGTPDVVNEIRRSGNIKGLQTVVVSEQPNDPSLRLVDLYDIVGGDAKYFTWPNMTAIVMRKAAHDFHRSPRNATGAKSEGLALFGSGSSQDLDCARILHERCHTLLTPETIQLFRYLQRSAKTNESRAEKDGGGGDIQEFEKDFVGAIDVNTTPSYLYRSNKSDDLRALGRLLYTQAVMDKVLVMFEKE